MGAVNSKQQQLQDLAARLAHDSFVVAQCGCGAI
jgi:hypothetical protein